ncbi:MAG: anaerobic ribonucleoside-triphosphate reductase activating protein [Bacilli bacterium]|nr:anaerobic ribonucleoside-triphosphate reductase activating protein [Bacilli bacterium]
MKIRLASKNIQLDSIVDGEGIRAVIWTQGCPHNCFGCHNPSTHSFNDGYLVDTIELKNEIDQFTGQDGITFSGGDPMSQPKECLEIAKYAKEKGLNIWCYTGFDYEKLLNNPIQREFLNYIDVLVDGKFKMEERTLDAPFRGSRNQRIIDVRRSLTEGNVVVLDKYNKVNNMTNRSSHDEENLFI